MTAPSSAQLLVALAGHARLFAESGEAAALAACAAGIERLIATTGRFGGRCVERSGDELLAVFPDAGSAVDAAIRMQRDASGEAGAGLRIGLDLGEPGPAPETVSGRLAHAAGCAAPGEILCAAPFAAILAAHGVAATPARQDAAGCHVIAWRETAAAPVSPAAATPVAPAPGRSLGLRYRGRQFLVDAGQPVLTLGRDLGNALVIEDRKASRRHARIERRDDGCCYLIDTSLNGSFVAAEGHREILVRQDEVRLEARGRICFGSSGNDPLADCAEFEIR